MIDGSIGTDLDRAADLLLKGGVVAFPTETVYGLGGCALNPHAVAKIFEAKGRPWFDPLIVHVAHLAEIEPLVSEFPANARQLAERFWPGPLTLVLPKQPSVPDLVTAGLPAVALRIPAHPLARALLERVGEPLAAPSANLFGQISPTTAQHVADQLAGRIDYILDGGPCAVGVESTVLDLTTNPPRLLRPGGLPLEELEAVLGPILVAASTSDPGQAESTAQSAPGLLPQHYAPRTPLRLLTSQRTLDETSGTLRLGLLVFTPPEITAGYAQVEVLSPTGDLREATANFFAALRRLDAAGLQRIDATPLPETGLGRALNDRLRRAAHD